MNGTLKLGPGDDLQMMKTPDAWEHRQYLPLVRRPMHDRDNLGIIVLINDIPRTRVFLCNMFDSRFYRLRMTGDPSDLPFKDYADFEAILDDDWKVD